MAHFKILSRILERLKGLFELQKCSLTVELGEDCIKIAETGVFQGKTEVTRLLKRQIDCKDKAAAAEAIGAVFKSAHIAHRHIRLNIPRHLVTVRLLKLPSVDDDEIGRIVKIESLKHVPYADENIVCGHRVIEKYEDGYSRVLIAVAQAENMQAIVELFHRAGLVVESAILGSESLWLWYVLSGTGQTDGTVLLLNFDEDHIDIDVIVGGKLVFTRGVSLGPHDGIPKEKIIEQIRLSSSVYQRESGNVIDKILLCGPLKKINDLKDSLLDRFSAPLDVMDQMNNILRSSTATLEVEDGSFTELLGLSLKSDEAKINLLPEAIQEANRFGLVKQYATISLVMVALIFGSCFGIVIKQLYDERATISRINREFQKVGPELKKAKKMVKQMELVTAHKTERPLAIDLLREVFKVTPASISITMMECETGKSMTLRGSAPSLSEVFKYATALGQSSCFNNVKVKYANKRVGQMSELADFEIMAFISKTKGSGERTRADKKPE